MFSFIITAYTGCDAYQTQILEVKSSKQAWASLSPVSDLPCSSNVVVQEQGEEVATVFGSIVALAALLHLKVDGGDLEDEATANSGHGSGQEGGEVSGDGLDQLLDVAVRVD